MGDPVEDAYQDFLAAYHQRADSINWWFPPVKAAIKERLGLPAEDSPWSQFLMKICLRLRDEMHEAFTWAGYGVRGVALRKSVPLGVAALYHRKSFPAITMYSKSVSMFGLFRSVNKAEPVDRNHFTSDLDFWVYHEGPLTAAESELKSVLGKILITKVGFIGNYVDIRKHEISEITPLLLFTSYFLWADPLLSCRAREFLDGADIRALFLEVVEHGCDLITDNPIHFQDMKDLEEDKRILADLQLVREQKKTPLLNHVKPHLQRTDPWWQGNRDFFSALQTNCSSIILGSSVSSAKGDEGERGRWVPHSVEGLRDREGHFVPAHSMVAKFRGDPQYKGDISDQKKLLKEYVVYCRLYNQHKGQLSFLATPGVIVLDISGIPFSFGDAQGPLRYLPSGTVLLMQDVHPEVDVEWFVIKRGKNYFHFWPFDMSIWRRWFATARSYRERVELLQCLFADVYTVLQFVELAQDHLDLGSSATVLLSRSLKRELEKVRQTLRDYPVPPWGDYLAIINRDQDNAQLYLYDFEYASLDILDGTFSHRTCWERLDLYLQMGHSRYNSALFGILARLAPLSPCLVHYSFCWLFGFYQKLLATLHSSYRNARRRLVTQFGQSASGGKREWIKFARLFLQECLVHIASGMKGIVRSRQ